MAKTTLRDKEAFALAAMRQDPVLFNRKILGRPEPVWYQRQIFESVRDHQATHVRSGNMVGKDWTAAGIALWRLYNFQPGIVITTGPSNTQVETVLWGEIRSAWRRAGLAGKLTRMPERISIADNHYAIGFSTAEPERLSGYHAPYVTVIVDEPTGIDNPEIWEAIDSLVNGPNDRLLTIGNPLRPEGRFYDYFARQLGNTISISSLESPNLGGLTAEQIVNEGMDSPVVVPGLATTDWVRRSAEQYGMGSNWWLAHVLGEFPRSTDDTTFPLFWLEESRGLFEAYAERVVKDAALTERLIPTRRIGVDVGEGHGGDESIIVVRDRLRVLEWYANRNIKPLELAGKIIQMAQKWMVNDDQVVIDDIGPGYGTRQELERHRFYVEAFRGGAQAADKVRFANRRAECYWHTREAINPALGAERFSIGHDGRLLAQLQATRHKEQADRVIALEPKEKIKERLSGESPDRGDALAMSFAPSKLGRLENLPRRL